MLFVHTYRKLDGLVIIRSLQVGERNIKPLFASERITMVVADGNELEHALWILGRAKSPLAVHKFFGDSAEEIFHNWDSPVL